MYQAVLDIILVNNLHAFVFQNMYYLGATMFFGTIVGFVWNFPDIIKQI